MVRKVFIALIGLFLVVVLVGFGHEAYECAERGGVRLRPAMGTYKCYDEASLRVITTEKGTQ